jgi:ATP-dependent DNA helicase RecG
VAFQIQSISETEFRLLSDAAESHFYELKSAENFDPVAKSLSAFANADGGRLIVGIADKRDTSGRLAGYLNQEAANGHVTEIMKMFSQTPDSITIEFLRVPGVDGLLLDMAVEKSSAVIATPTGEIYTRLNAQNLRLKGSQAIQELAWKKGQESYENVKTEEPESFIDSSKTFAHYQERLVPHTAPQAYMQKEKLSREGFSTVAGVMLFDDNPQATVTQGAIKIYRYKTVNAEGEREEFAGDPITIEGPAYKLVYDAVKQTSAIIESIEVLGNKGFEKIKYPQDAIHEVICNAVIHRDYSVHDYIHIRVFDNRVEVESPGRLPGHITLDNILSQRFARNKRVVRILNKFPDPPNKDVGEGLNTAFSSMRSMDLRDPSIQERTNSVCVILAHEPLASKEKIIEQYLKRNGVINNTTGREICFEPSESKVRKMFQRMIEAQVLEKIPNTGGRGTRYRLRGGEREPERAATLFDD